MTFYISKTNFISLRHIHLIKRKVILVNGNLFFFFLANSLALYKYIYICIYQHLLKPVPQDLVCNPLYSRQQILCEVVARDGYDVVLSNYNLDTIDELTIKSIRYFLWFAMEGKLDYNSCHFVPIFVVHRDSSLAFTLIVQDIKKSGTKFTKDFTTYNLKYI